mgnify:CR=1 FL=1
MVAASHDLTANALQAPSLITAQAESFEVYPNRDSYPFMEDYRFDPAWKVRDFVRGTIRLNGWAEAWAPIFREIEGLEGKSDAEINAASDQVCRAMGWNKNHFNVMWNRHVGLGPDQLRARMSGRTVSGSLGDKVPGLTGGQDASSYGTPAMALHALYDVADAMRSGELANDGSVDEVLEHGQPVGISALAPRGKIRTVSGTLVTLSPPTNEDSGFLHLTPVATDNSEGLDNEAARILHKASSGKFPL